MKASSFFRSRSLIVSTLICALMALAAAPMSAERAAARNTTRTSVSGDRNTNVNRNTNVKANRNTNVNVNRRGYYGGAYYRGPTVAGVVAATVATAIVVGAIVSTLPPSCSTLVVNGLAYQNCGGTYYQPQYQGSSVTYVVVKHP
jgi:hypothetical protein